MTAREPFEGPVTIAVAGDEHALGAPARRADARTLHLDRLMPLAEDFTEIVESLPDDWTDLELDLRIADEGRYVDAAVMLCAGQRPALLARGLALAHQRRPPFRARRRGRDGARHPRQARPRGHRRRAADPRRAPGPGRGRADVGPARERAPRVPPAPQPLEADSAARAGPRRRDRRRPDAREPGDDRRSRAPATRSSRPRSIPDELDGVDLVVADLDAAEPEGSASLGRAGDRLLPAHRHRDQGAARMPPGSRSRCRARAWSASCPSWSSARWTRASGLCGLSTPHAPNPINPLGSGGASVVGAAWHSGMRSSRKPAITSAAPFGSSDRGSTPFASAHPSQSSTACPSIAAVAPSDPLGREGVGRDELRELRALGAAGRTRGSRPPGPLPRRLGSSAITS